MNMKPKFSIWWMLILVVLIALLCATLIGSGKDDKKISTQDFDSKLEAGEVAGVHLYGTTVYICTVGDDAQATQAKLEKFPGTFDYYITVAYTYQLEDIEHTVDAYNAAHASDPDYKAINVTTEPVKEGFLQSILPYVSVLVLICMGVLAYRALSKMTGKGMDFGRSKARMESGLKVRFKDVAGCDEEKQEMQEIVEFLKNPKKFSALGARVPKGVLLVGPPGTGKTLLAKAIAGEAGVPFFSITGSDFVEMYVGVGAARVRDLFETAKKNTPCLIFIDEIDAVGRQRGAGLGNTNDEREQTLNQLLVQMDGFEASSGIVVIAATNRPDVLDPALLRAGRFDRRIVVNKPNLEGRVKILQLYAQGKPFADDVDWEGIARRLPGATGADIENILNEAAILAVRDNRNLITETDIFEGSLKVEYGPKKKNYKTTPEEQKSTAYHEAGHTIVIKTLNGADRDVQEVTIIPRGMSGGMTSQVDRKHGDASQMTRDEMLSYITGLMGGRAAEKVIYGHVATGASNDIEVATNIARDMVTKYGMSEKLGPVCYGSEDEVFLGRDFQQRSNISEATASLIDSEIKSIIETCEADAIKILSDNKAILEEMCKTLLQKMTIYSDEVNELMSGKSSEEVVAAMEAREAVRKQKDAEALERKKKAEEEKLKNATLAQQNANSKESALAKNVLGAFKSTNPENNNKKVDATSTAPTTTQKAEETTKKSQNDDEQPKK